MKSETRKIERTPEEKARHAAIRAKFQSEKPTLPELIEKGDTATPIPLGTYLSIQSLLHRLKQEREATGLSLADVAEKTGMDRAAISRLENGHQLNPTVDTIIRYAAALGKSIIWSFGSAESTPEKV